MSLSTSVYAQVLTPQPSPSSKLYQTVGLTEVSVEFSRPHARKNHHGELVPYGAFGEIENKTPSLPLVMPLLWRSRMAAECIQSGKEQWKYFSTATQNWGTPDPWDAAGGATVEVTPTTGEDIETFSFGFLTCNNGGTLNLGWVDTREFRLACHRSKECFYQRSFWGTNTATTTARQCIIYRKDKI